MVTLITIHSSIQLLILIQEANADFDDIGKLMLGGVIAAVVVAIAFIYIRLRLREKNPHASDFISISANQTEKDKAGR